MRKVGSVSVRGKVPHVDFCILYVLRTCSSSSVCQSVVVELLPRARFIQQADLEERMENCAEQTTAVPVRAVRLPSFFHVSFFLLL
jgi:hypothetical protein